MYRMNICMYISMYLYRERGKREGDLLEWLAGCGTAILTMAFDNERSKNPEAIQSMRLEMSADLQYMPESLIKRF